MRRSIVPLVVALLAAAPLAAFQVSAPAPTPPATGQSSQPAPPAPAPPRAPALQGPSLNGANVRLEITLTDTFAGAPEKKTVGLTILSGYSGMIRTTNRFSGNEASLNVDATLTAYPSGQIPLRLTVSYRPIAQDTQQQRGFENAAEFMKKTPAVLEESITVVLMDGQTLVLSESADPVTARKVTLEAKAIILK